jgi:hypothetical protein
MLIRFFNDWGLRGEPVLYIGIARPTADRGEASEAVRLATPEDRERYPEAYAAYEKSLPAPEEKEELSHAGNHQRGSGRGADQG